MAIIDVPKKPSILSKVIQPAASLLGAAVGSIVPGPGTTAGAALGSAIGGAAGGVAKGIMDKDAGQVLGGAANGIAATAGGLSSMQRRLDSQTSNAVPSVPMSPATQTLADGMKAVGDLPPEQQTMYGPQISDAYRRSLHRDFLRQGG